MKYKEQTNYFQTQDMQERNPFIAILTNTQSEKRTHSIKEWTTRIIVNYSVTNLYEEYIDISFVFIFCPMM